MVVEVTARTARAANRALPAIVILLLAGCGSGGSGGSSAIVDGSGDSATFVIDSRTVSVTQSGTTSVRLSGAPELNYSGPVGCAGRFFTADFVSNLRLYFRYSSRDAYLLLGSELYYLGGAPRRHGSQLEWSATVNNRQIAIRVACPPPPPGPPLTASATPGACSLLTAAIATTALREKVGRPKFLQENPELSYCEYKSVDKSFNGDRRLAVSVASATELASLSSWSQPPIAGLGDEAHGGDASIGLAVRKGKLGLEVVADLGVSGSARANLATEESVARKLVAALPG
jgi:hypothetical protein